ncbi:hypothetical protein [Burkholderia perseverans]|uniref:hypothetical protein n=1 Tax=Burkholderia perseverans TaxID=2615214 RepID=UPI001FEE444B|nr:hypothetical protein [Burkholderia perseverans]
MTMNMVAWIVILMAAFFCEPAASQAALPVVSSYGNCRWADNGNGTITASLTINYNEAKKGLGFSPSFITRGVMAWGYGSDGHAKIVPWALSANVELDGVGYDQRWDNTQAVGGLLGSFLGGSNHSWINAAAFSANVTITFKSGGWQGLTVEAGNVGADLFESVYTFYLEQTGAAYLYPGSDGGGCEVVDPVNPPKPPLTILMSAPDWDLGELPTGHGEKRFTAAADQLCFWYSGSTGNGAAVVVDAESQNGVINYQYRLKALADPTQVIPYTVTLNAGSYDINLPNRVRLPIVLNASGRTCFTSVFHTEVSPGQKSGDYSDVLTFTVVSFT